MSTIWRADSPVSDLVMVTMPEGAALLHVTDSDRIPFGMASWWLVDPGQPNAVHSLRVIGTGNPVPDKPGQYVGSFSQQGGALVWHVFKGGAA